jgi:hypothetical protein
MDEPIFLQRTRYRPSRVRGRFCKVGCRSISGQQREKILSIALASAASGDVRAI